jgi:hypothetical protein
MDVMLNDLDEFMQACFAHSGFLTGGNTGTTFIAGELYCPGCGGPRRMRMASRNKSFGDRAFATGVEGLAAGMAPAAFTLRCVQDDTEFSALLFQGPDRYELAIFPAVRGGLATPHTPAGVGFYLDQAQRAQSAAANSAAVAMYRAAIEHVLYEQGFTDRMLGPKLKALQAAINDGTAPKWASELDAAYLSVINQLAAGAIHPGDGDVAKQSTFDSEILTQLEITLAELVHVVYERHHEEQARLDALKAAAATFQPPATP